MAGNHDLSPHGQTVDESGDARAKIRVLAPQDPDRDRL